MPNSPHIRRRRLIEGAGAASLVASLAMPAIAQNKPIRLGWIAAVSGMFAADSLAMDAGFRMKVADLNEQGGLLGRKLEIIARDSASDPSKAVSFAKELVYNENIDILCGPATSGEGLPTLGIVAGAKKLQLLGGTVEELIDPVKYPLAFRYINTNSQWIKVAVKFMVEELKKTKVAIINDNTMAMVCCRARQRQNTWPATISSRSTPQPPIPVSPTSPTRC